MGPKETHPKPSDTTNGVSSDKAKAGDKTEMSDEELKDVSGGPIYMSQNIGNISVNQPTLPTGAFTGGVRGG